MDAIYEQRARRRAKAIELSQSCTISAGLIYVWLDMADDNLEAVKAAIDVQTAAPRLTWFGNEQDAGTVVIRLWRDEQLRKELARLEATSATP